MKRIFYFVATNILVIATISLLINILGVRPYLSARGINYQSLLVFCALWGFLGSFISLQMSRWTAKRAMGVRLLDERHPLVGRIAKLCRAAGLRTLPEIGIYQSPEVNAFATGPSQSRSLLAVSSGLLEAMDDDAVDGVLGHEIAHIVNGDMVTMALLQGVVNTFVMFLSRLAAFAIDQALRSKDDDRRGGEGLGYFAQYILIFVFESTLMLLASPLICYFSRSREYRADAGSAKIGGKETMIHALESLKRCTDLIDSRQPALSTLKISGRTPRLLGSLFSTHPPLDARIQALRNI